jgi:hypothetical protein
LIWKNVGKHLLFLQPKVRWANNAEMDEDTGYEDNN